MVESKTELRVRYGETDQMGIVNNANYPTYYEIGRTEMFRQLGISYKTLESLDVMLPLSELHVKFAKPAFYDDVLTIHTRIEDMPASRIRFDYKIYNENEDLINEGYTTLAFLNAKTRRPIRMPDMIASLLKPHFR
ncbi:acyl-CoA thioesterase [Marinilabiliaceae bacterium JC017]|nr:acyl-CoA thioesterase [Marinilabiliaceae bacterium JC017]